MSQWNRAGEKAGFESAAGLYALVLKLLKVLLNILKGCVYDTFY